MAWILWLVGGIELICIDQITVTDFFECNPLTGTFNLHVYGTSIPNWEMDPSRDLTGKFERIFGIPGNCYLQQAQESMGWREKFSGGRITCYQDLSFNPLGLKILVSDRSPYISLKNKLGEFDNRSKNSVSIVDHFVSSPKLSLWLSIDI